MRRSRTLGVAASLILCLTVVPASSWAAPTAGGSCAKAGSSTQIKGKTYKCVKSGKKLLWKLSGNAITKPSTPTVTPTTTPTAPKTRRQKVLAEAKRVYEANGAYQVPLQFTRSPGSVTEFAQLIPETVAASGRFWSDIYRPAKFPVLISNEKELDWMLTEMGKYGHRLNDRDLSSIASQGNRAGKGDFRINEESGITFYVIGTATGAETARSPQYQRGFIAHEYTHAVHGSIFNHRDQGMPQWGVEGTANFYGFIVTALMSANPESTYEDLTRNNLRRPLDGGLVLHSLSRDDLYKALVRSETYGSGSNCAEPLLVCYTAGQLLTEILVADYGHAKFIEWWRLSRTMTWEQAFSQTFGIEIDRWYEEVAVPYILEESAKAIPQIARVDNTSEVRQRDKRADRKFDYPGYRSALAIKAMENIKAISFGAGGVAKITHEVNADKAMAEDLDRIVKVGLDFFSDVDSQGRTLNVFHGGEQDAQRIYDRISSIDSRFAAVDRNEYSDELSRNGMVQNLRARSDVEHLTYLFKSSRLSTFNGSYRLANILSQVTRVVQQRATSYQVDALPCWARVTDTSFYGAAILRKAEHFDYFEIRKSSLGDYAWGREGYDFTKFSALDFSDFLNRNDGSRTCEGGTYNGPIGWLLTENLVGTYGHAKVILWWKSFASSRDWKANFERTFGQSADLWLRDVGVPYLVQEYQRWTPYS